MLSMIKISVEIRLNMIRKVGRLLGIEVRRWGETGTDTIEEKTLKDCGYFVEIWYGSVVGGITFIKPRVYEVVKLERLWN